MFNNFFDNFFLFGHLDYFVTVSHLQLFDNTVVHPNQGHIIEQKV